MIAAVLAERGLSRRRHRHQRRDDRRGEGRALPDSRARPRRHWWPSGVASGRADRLDRSRRRRKVRARVLITVGTPLSEDFDRRSRPYPRRLRRRSRRIVARRPDRDDQEHGAAGHHPRACTTRSSPPVGAACTWPSAPSGWPRGRRSATSRRSRSWSAASTRRPSEAAAAFWREALPVEVMTLSSPEAAEMVKLADNLWIDLNIALANELAKLVDALPWPIDVHGGDRAAPTR